MPSHQLLNQHQLLGNFISSKAELALARSAQGKTKLVTLLLAKRNSK